MAAQRTTFSRTQRLARRCFRRLLATRALAAFGKLALPLALSAVLLLTALGQAAPTARAASDPPGCPTWYTDGAAECQGKVTEVGPPVGGPPPHGFVLGSWTVCVPWSTILAWAGPSPTHFFYDWWD